MVSQRRLLKLMTMLILLSLFTVACERPLGGTGDGATDDQAVQTEDANAGVETDSGSDAEVGDTTDATTTDTTPTDSTGDAAADSSSDDTTTTSESGETTTDAGATTQDDSSEVGGGVGDATTDTGDATQTTGDEVATDTTSTANEEGSVDEATTDTTANNTTENSATSSTIPQTHTVAAGENLYRIGLKYGVSWVAIANANSLANPNILTVGQVLKLPGATGTDPGPTPSPQTETTYIVQAGDNLFRIGLKFGISWVQIAEANGLVNPNLIAAEDELKIPVNTPGHTPQFSHVVKAGDTLFLISLQYGVAWPAIAEANNLTSPYIIYVGQTLVIPGSQ
jgi:LysM repeat protein